LKRVLFAAAVSLTLGAAPAQAIHDPVVPAGPCAAANSEAVGHPAAPHLLETGQITGFPVSAHTPGASTGTTATATSQGDENCAVNNP
jgi:hypothetical protein